MEKWTLCVHFKIARIIEPHLKKILKKKLNIISDIVFENTLKYCIN